jgi:Trk-type K+ transport system membrane component
MNRKIVFNITGKILQALSVILILPMIVSLIYKENCILAFFITAVVSLSLPLKWI